MLIFIIIIQMQSIRLDEIWKSQTGELRFSVEYRFAEDVFVEIFQHPNERILLTPFATNAADDDNLESEVSSNLLFSLHSTTSTLHSI